MKRHMEIRKGLSVIAVLFLFLLASRAEALEYLVCAETRANQPRCGTGSNKYQPLKGLGLISLAEYSSDHSTEYVEEEANAAVYGSDSSWDTIIWQNIEGLGIEPMAHAMAETKISPNPDPSLPWNCYQANPLAGAFSTITIKHRLNYKEPDPPSEILFLSVPLKLKYRMKTSEGAVTTAGFTIQMGTFSHGKSVGNGDSDDGTLSFNSRVFQDIFITASASANAYCVDTASGPHGVSAQAVADPFLYVDPNWEYAHHFVVEQESTIFPGEWVEVTRAWESQGSETLNLREYQITMSPAYETTPTLGNDGVSDLVVYSVALRLPNGSLAPADIWYQRLGNDDPFGPAVQVTNDPTDDLLNDISGDYIVYTAFDSVISASGSIMLYRISTRELQPIARAEIAREPRICGNTVVWVQGSSTASQVMLYDLAWLGTAQQAFVVAGPIPPASQVQVGSRYIVWTEYAGDQFDVQAFDLTSYTRMAITASPDLDDTEPSTFGDWVVWQSRVRGSPVATIWAFNPTTFARFPIADNGAGNFRPSIDGDLVAYESNLHGNLDIFLYRMSDGQTFQVTNIPSDQYLNDVFGNKVAYVDMRSGNEDVWVTIFNQSPAANAGLDETVHAGASVTLDGSSSYDPDENYPLTYSWSILSKPQGSSAELSGADSVNPSFIADLLGDYVVQLVATDSAGWSSLPDSVTITTANSPPVADAGPDQNLIFLGSDVYLDGSQSYDSDGDQISFQWSFHSKPDGSNAMLSDADTANPTFVADAYGTYRLILTVADPFGASASDSVDVSFDNLHPVADAGGNQAVVAPVTVLLDGSGSSDPNGDPLTYQWNLATKPEGSAAELYGAGAVSPSFEADLPGTYVVNLIVSDGLLSSEPSSVTVTATAGVNEAITILMDTVAMINALPPSSFKNRNMSKPLTNKIAAVISLIEQGNYAEALDKLNRDILPKMDGCAKAGAPDKNDWITDCDAQEEVYPSLVEVVELLKLFFP